MLTNHTRIASASFIQLVPAGGLTDVSILNGEIYRVFPFDSKDLPSGKVPTRVNSPSDDAFGTRESGSNLTFTTSVISREFRAQNSVLNGITVNGGGDGAVAGQEVWKASRGI